MFLPLLDIVLVASKSEVIEKTAERVYQLYKERTGGMYKLLKECLSIIYDKGKLEECVIGIDAEYDFYIELGQNPSTRKTLYIARDNDDGDIACVVFNIAAEINDTKIFKDYTLDDVEKLVDDFLKD